MVCRETGVIFNNIDISLGDISVDLNENLLSIKKKSSDTHADQPVQSTTEADIIAKKQQKKQDTLVAITKHASLFPEKVSEWFLYIL